MLFQQFSNFTKYVRIVGKLSNQHFNALLLSIPGEKVLILIEGGRLINLKVFLLLGPFPLDWRIIMHRNVGRTYVVKLENSQNNISMYGCSPSQGKIYFFLIFLLLFYEVKISECNIYIYMQSQFWKKSPVAILLTYRSSVRQKFPV